MTTAQAEALRIVREVALAAREAGELPEFLGELERMRVEVLLTAITAPTTVVDPTGDRVLSTAETAKKLGKSEWWIRQNKDSLPIVRHPTGSYGFSEVGLSRWIRRRTG